MQQKSAKRPRRPCCLFSNKFLAYVPGGPAHRVVRYSSPTVSGTSAHYVECSSLQLLRVTSRRTEQQLDSVLRTQYDKTPSGQHAVVDYLRCNKLIHQKPSLDSMLLLTCCKLKTNFQHSTRWTACSLAESWNPTRGTCNAKIGQHLQDL